MDDINTVTVIGRLTRDAELKPSQYPIGFFTVAVNRKKKHADGNSENEASYFDVDVYNEYAQIMTPKLKKGMQVCVDGELKQERWIDRETKQNRSRVVIAAKTIQILGGRDVQ